MPAEKYTDHKYTTLRIVAKGIQPWNHSSGQEINIISSSHVFTQGPPPHAFPKVSTKHLFRNVFISLFWFQITILIFPPWLAMRNLTYSCFSLRVVGCVLGASLIQMLKFMWGQSHPKSRQVSGWMFFARTLVAQTVKNLSAKQETQV